MRVNPRLHGFRHSADDVVVFQIFFHRDRIKCRQLTVKLIFSDTVYIFRPAVCNDKFFKTHRIHFKPVNLTYRKRYPFFTQRDSQQRTRCYNVQLQLFLVKVFKRLYCPRTILNLIKDNQRFFRENFMSIYGGFKFIDDSFNIKIEIKDRLQPHISIKIKICRFFKCSFAEFTDKVGFTALPDTCHQQGFTVLLIFPVD